MRSRFPLLLLASLALAGGIVWIVVATNQAALVTLEGSILKVRTYPLNAQSTLVIADFRITNPSALLFEVDSLEMFVDRAGSPPAPAGILGRTEVDLVFQYQKLTGPKYNNTLIVSNRIQPGATLDRMIAGRVELTEAEIESRTGVRLRIQEFRGQVAEIAEAPALK